MANLKDIRDRIKSVKSIQKVTKAMKMVAAAKMRRAQENMEKARPYNHRLVEIIQHLLPSVERSMLPLLEIRDVKRMAYVVVTSDRGLAGSFNSSILRKAHSDIDEFGKENVDRNVRPSMGAEDFSYMLQERPGCYFFLGNGDLSDDSGNKNIFGPCMLHNSHYDFNDELIALGAKFWFSLITKRLGLINDG